MTVFFTIRGYPIPRIDEVI